MMKSESLRLLSFLVAVIFGCATLPLAAGSPPADALRPEVGKPLQAAQQLIKEQKYKDALAKVGETDAIPNKTPYEKLIIEQMRSVAANGAGDVDTAAKATDAVIATGKLGHDQELKLMQVMVSSFYRAKEYSKALGWAQRYQKAGGNDPEMDTLIAQSYYLSGDYAGAAREMQNQVAAAEKAGRTPTETQLQLLASCYLKQNDKAGYARTLQELVAYYPKKEYWADVLVQIQRKPGFSDRLTLDVYRLMMATGNLTQASDYMEMAQLALQAGFPVEAQQVINQGYANRALGTGPEAERQKRLKDLADKQAAEDKKSLNVDAQALAKRGADAMVATGYNLTLNGKVDQGIALMQQGIAQGGLKHPEDAKLHLGEAYLRAGKTAEANKVLKTVQGTDGTQDLARLWSIRDRAS
jgi:hypothetical protein